MGRANTGRRIRRSAAQWSRLIEEQATSGLSKRGFCEARGLAPSSFTKALARQELPNAAQPPRRSDSQRDFVPVTVENVGSEHWEFEVQLGTSLFIRIRGA